MRPLAFHGPTAEFLFFGSLVLVNVIELVVRPRTRRGDGRSRDWSLAFILAALLVGIVSAALAAGHRLAPLPGGPWWPVIAGVIVMWLGFAFRIWAIVTMGRFFQVTVVVQDGHRVIERGPYRWLRHPSYLGSIVLLGGIGLAEGDYASIALMLAGGLVAFLVRIHVEERVLLATLGDDYEAYAQRTARLIPGLY
jgi:protein-S-isoprenylcysteine O-methyltransferase Ste14